MQGKATDVKARCRDFRNISGCSVSSHKTSKATTQDSGHSKTTPAPRIMLVEDETVICLDIEDLLEHEGYEVTCVANHLGRAMELLHENAGTIDCAVIDVQLCNRTCQPLVEALEKLLIPYVLITGHGVDFLREIGVSGPVVQKPFLDERLMPALSDILGASDR